MGEEAVGVEVVNASEAGGPPEGRLARIRSAP